MDSEGTVVSFLDQLCMLCTDCATSQCIEEVDSFVSNEGQ